MRWYNREGVPSADVECKCKCGRVYRGILRNELLPSCAECGRYTVVVHHTVIEGDPCARHITLCAICTRPVYIADSGCTRCKS